MQFKNSDNADQFGECADFGTVRLERRDGEFGSATPGKVLSGACCCCCCCLHWIGALIGGAIGLPMGWVTKKKKLSRPVHPKVHRTLMTGMFVGIGVVFLGIVVFSVLASIGGGDIASVPLIAIVFVPSLVFVPIGACMMLFTLLLKKSDPLAGSDSGYVDGIYCPRCMYDLRGSLESTACPECGKVIDQDKLARGVDYGIGIAWRSTWLSVSLSTLISGVGYLIMVGIWAVTEYM